jgi:general secretion pathway protein A
MYLGFYGFTEEPFNVTPDPKFLFLDERYREALAHLEYGVLYGKGFVLLTGEVGTGKTTLLNAFLERLPKEFASAFVFSTTMSFVELLKMIHDDFETGQTGDSEATLLIGLNRFLIRQYQEEKNAVLVFDEAQNLSQEMLEKIRLLSNLEARKAKLLQIVLAGQPELADRLEDPTLRQLRQRIAIRYALSPLTRAETNRYIDHRLSIAESKGLVSFTDAAVDLIFKYSSGIPRLVNVLCANALLLGFGAGKRKIDEILIGEVIADLSRPTPRVAPPPTIIPFPERPAAADATIIAMPAHAGAPGAHAPHAPVSAASSAGASAGSTPPAAAGSGNGGGVLPEGRAWTAEEAAHYLRISPAGMRRFFRSGEIPARRVGRGWRVLKEDLDRFLRGGPTAPPSEKPASAGGEPAPTPHDTPSPEDRSG